MTLAAPYMATPQFKLAREPAFRLGRRASPLVGQNHVSSAAKGDFDEIP
jgi:hypothetical protein